MEPLVALGSHRVGGGGGGGYFLRPRRPDDMTYAVYWTLKAN